MALPGTTLHSIFRERARVAPDGIAVSGPGGAASYRELDVRSDRLAARLAVRGVGPNVLVGLCARRSVEAVVGMLGILKAGGAYVPVDPDHPAERVGYLLADCAARVVVGTGDTPDVGEHREIVRIDIDDDKDALVPVDRVRHEDLAYVIYTSGSTGRPKGVTVEHRNAVRLFEQTQPWFDFGPDDVWAQFHSLSFDFSVWEIWGALLHGGRLVVLPDVTVRSPRGLVSLLRTEGVTVLNQTPSAFHQLLSVLFTSAHSAESTDGLALRYLIFGGEKLDPPALRPWIERHGDRRPALVNMYGVTETTVHCTYRPISTTDLDGAEGSPIGIPIPDLRLYLLDPSGEPVPDGVPGELYVAGAGVARGYLNRPDLTAARFIEGPSGLDEDRVYRTGDRAVRPAGGELEYLGRVDDQLKVRGFRIEPGEVEACLVQVPEVGKAVVVARDFGGGDVRLVAFLLPTVGVEIDAAALAGVAERQVMTRLPRHLRPSLYKVVSEIPMTLQGKVDRDALSK